MPNIIRKLVENDKKELKKLNKMALQVESFADEMEHLTDEQLKAKTPELKERIAKGESLDDLLYEAFAVCREAARRVLGLYPFHVQIMGGIVLHNGDVPEMRTGEGKTLTATMPVYLNALSGKGVHVVTVNEYLATRDMTEMGELYSWLGLTVGLNLNSKSPEEKREAYNCDITYSTSAELGFDYLRDNMVTRAEDMVQKPLNYALVDEVDSILVDEARTPLIISGQAESSSALYYRADQFTKTLKGQNLNVATSEYEEGDDYKIDLQSKTISLTEEGIDKAEKFFQIENLYDMENVALTHFVDNALRANFIMLHDIDYMVDENQEVLIIDQFTGRTMPGRRYSDGLHQAIEAKEGVPVQEETKTSASITYQNLFRMYKKLSGMTGTGKTEEEEFREIYNIRVIPIPTNRPIARIDHPDLLYPSLKSKFKAVVEDVKSRHEKGQPVLVGTVAVETSDYLSQLLVQAGVPHEVLNAKNHYKEAQIIMNAGQRGAVTIATNMAGRGTDIKLGEGVRELGGLCVIGTERHESRRIDNQLRGRSGRQGDPGETQFYLSLEDDLMKRFGGERMQAIWERLNIDENGDDNFIQSKMLSRQVESSQKRVEGNNYDTRKNVLQYDEVMREQREIIYSQRLQIINEENSLEKVTKAMIRRTIHRMVENHTLGEKKTWDLESLVDFAANAICHPDDISLSDLKGKTPSEIEGLLNEKAMEIYKEKQEQLNGDSQMLEFEKVVILRVVDRKWTDHIDDMDQLREGVGLRGYAQIDPLTEYQTEGFNRFQQMIAAIDYDVTRILMKSQIRQNLQREQVQGARSVIAQGHDRPNGEPEQA